MPYTTETYQKAINILENFLSFFCWLFSPFVERDDAGIYRYTTSLVIIIDLVLLKRNLEELIEDSL